MSRPLKLKVSGTVLCSVFQLPDHGFIGQFAGAHRRRFSLKSWIGPGPRGNKIENVSPFPFGIVGDLDLERLLDETAMRLGNER
jgi:hypothetical protein